MSSCLARAARLMKVVMVEAAKQACPCALNPAIMCLTLSHCPRPAMASISILSTLRAADKPLPASIPAMCGAMQSYCEQLGV